MPLASGCSANCDACTGALCTKCSDGFFHLVDGVTNSCVDTCPPEEPILRFENNTYSCWRMEIDGCALLVGQPGAWECYFCMLGRFKRPDNGCGHCRPGCGFCGDTTGCLACLPGLFMHDTLCRAACPAGLYPDDASRTCAACPAPCSTCTGPAECTACHGGKLAHGSQCVDLCPMGLYSDGHMCVRCPAGCQSCLSPGFCSRCHPGYLHHALTCVDTCPAGHYPNEAEGLCASCAEPCATCWGPGPEACTSCPAGRHLHAGACVAACPAGTFASGGACAACPDPCAACTRAEACTQCKSPRFLSDGACVAACPGGTFADADTGACVPCTGACATCTGPGQCTSCAGPRLLHQGTCVEACPAGHFAQAGACAACGPRCAACSDAATCTACAPGYPLHRGACVAGCPGFFFDRANECLPCPAGCALCHEADACDVCLAGMVKHESRCLAGCPAGTHVTSDPDHQSQRLCQACHPLCAECAGPAADQCTACDGSLTIRQPIPPVDPPLAEGMCVPDCMNNPSQCAECEPTCDLCRALPDDQTFCMVCRAPMLALEGRCVDACPPGHAPMVATGHCARCAGECGGACSGPAGTQCLNCPDGKVLQGGECRDACMAAGWYAASPTTCKRCHGSCSQCAGPEADQCTACPRGTLRLATAGPASSPPPAGALCVSACPEGLVADPLRGECQPCHPACATCSGPLAGECVACPAGGLLHQGACVAACPAGFRPAAGHAHCEACAAGCAECPAGADLCTRCRPGHFLVLGAGACATACPEGHLTDATARECAPCAGACARCAGTPDTCTRCRDPGLRLRAHTGECVAACAAGEAEATGLGSQAGLLLCRACHATCATCRAPDSAGACDSCPAGRFLLAGGTCVAACPEGHFPADDTGQCTRCSPACRSCSGPASDHCLSCAGAAAILHQGACTDACPADGFWLDDRPPAGRACVPCRQDCLRCPAGGDHCSACRPGHFPAWPDPALGLVCVDSCPAGTFLQPSPDHDQGRCTPCSKGCHTCTGPTPPECTRTWCQADDTCTAARNRHLAVGLGVGLTVLLLLLLLVLVLVHVCLRRRRPAAPGPEEKSADVDMTILNTFMDLSLPGFLLLSVAHDIRILSPSPEQSGSQGGIFAVEPVTSALAAAAGPNSIVMKMAHEEGGSSLPAAQVQAMFENELSILWALQQSPNVVRLLGYTQAPSAILMVREVIDLAGLLSSASLLDKCNILALLRGMATGLAFIHAQGIAHRDIKSHNVLVGPCPDTGAMRPVFADFGVSIAVSRGSTLLDSTMLEACSVAFAAPEVLASLRLPAPGPGRRPDYMAADVFSLATVFWHVLTLTRPWNGLGSDATVEAVLQGRTPDSHGPPAHEALLQDPLLAGLANASLPAMWSMDPGQRPPMAATVLALEG